MAAARRLFPLWARFDDWMGVLSLLRGVPVQRQYPLRQFVEDLERWLGREEDLFEALRKMSRREAAGQVPLPEVLRTLAMEAS